MHLSTFIYSCKTGREASFSPCASQGLLQEQVQLLRLLWLWQGPSLLHVLNVYDAGFFGQCNPQETIWLLRLTQDSHRHNPEKGGKTCIEGRPRPAGTSEQPPRGVHARGALQPPSHSLPKGQKRLLEARFLRLMD